MLTVLQVNLIAIAGVLGTRHVCRRLGLPTPPLWLPLLAACTLPWLEAFRTNPSLDVASNLQNYIGACTELLAGYTIIRLLGWLVLELPAHFRWWKAIPKILGDLLMLGAAATVTLVVIQQQLKVNLIGIAATSAVLTAVVGLAGQSTLKDIFAGIALQIDAPFAEGDWIDLGTTSGIVVSLRLMSTRLSTMDGAQIALPNSRITSEGLRRFRPKEPIGSNFQIALDFSLPARQAIGILEDVLLRHPRILNEPRPRGWVKGYSDTGVIYQAQYWRYGIGDLADKQLRSELLEQTWYALRRAGQTIPYPGIDLRRKPTNNAQPQQTASVDRRAKTLRDNQLFRHLDTETISELAMLSRCRLYAPEEYVVRQGEEGQTLYVIMRGRLAVKVENERNNDNRIGHLEVGDIFGEMAVFTGSPRAASVICLSESLLLEIERDDLLVLIKQNPLVLDRLSDLIAEREQALRERDSQSLAKEQHDLAQKIKDLFEGLLTSFY